MMQLKAKCQTLRFNFGELRFDSSPSSSSSSITALSRFLFCLLLSLHQSCFAIFLSTFSASTLSKGERERRGPEQDKYRQIYTHTLQLSLTYLFWLFLKSSHVKKCLGICFFIPRKVWEILVRLRLLDKVPTNPFKMINYFSFFF